MSPEVGDSEKPSILPRAVIEVDVSEFCARGDWKGSVWGDRIVLWKCCEVIVVDFMTGRYGLWCRGSTRGVTARNERRCYRTSIQRVSAPASHPHYWTWLNLLYLKVICLHGYLAAMTHRDIIVWECAASALAFEAEPTSLFEDIQSWMINLPPPSASPDPCAVIPVPFPEPSDTAGPDPSSSDTPPLLVLPSPWYLFHPHRLEISDLDFDVLYGVPTADNNSTGIITHGVRYRLRYRGSGRVALREEETGLGTPFEIGIVSKFRFPQLRVRIEEEQNHIPGYFFVSLPASRGHEGELPIWSNLNACCVYEPEGVGKEVDTHLCVFRDVRLSLLYPGSRSNVGSCISGISIYRAGPRVAEEEICVVDFP